MTEQQRLEAIALCDRFLEAHKRVTRDLGEAIQGLLCAIKEIQPKPHGASHDLRPAVKPRERFTVGQQPCQNFLRGDADIAALGEGNHMNLHQCPKCSGNRAWCDNCSADHHDGGWETCKPGAYDYRED